MNYLPPTHIIYNAKKRIICHSRESGNPVHPPDGEGINNPLRLPEQNQQSLP